LRNEYTYNGLIFDTHNTYNNNSLITKLFVTLTAIIVIQNKLVLPKYLFTLKFTKTNLDDEY